MQKEIRVASSEKERNSGIEPGQVHGLKTLVEYAEGSIVSRALIQKDVGTVTLFAFDQGQGLSEHTTPFDAMVQVVDGEGEFVIGGKSNHVGEGQLLLMPAGIPHAVKANRRFKMMLTMIRR